MALRSTPKQPYSLSLARTAEGAYAQNTGISTTTGFLLIISAVSRDTACVNCVPKSRRLNTSKLLPVELSHKSSDSLHGGAGNAELLGQVASGITKCRKITARGRIVTLRATAMSDLTSDMLKNNAVGS